jgi:hypothetical protein
MGFLTDFEEDVFISYATIDDDCLPGEKAGWVAQLHEDLTRRVKVRLGADNVQMWRDYQIGANAVFETTIKGRLDKTAALLSILSPSFLTRDWTKLELAEFVQRARDGIGLVVNADKSRIFKVEKLEVSRESLPLAMQGTRSYKFCKPDPDRPNISREFRPQVYESDRIGYFKELDNLAIDIASLLRDMAQAAPPKASLGIYVAETTYGLNDQLTSVRRELSDRGYAVYPQGDLSRRPEEFIEQVRSDLKRSVLSVHLVGAMYGLIPEGEIRSIGQIQHELAMERGASDPDFVRLIWMPEGLVPIEESQRKFIEHLQNDAEVQKNAEIMEAKLDELKSALRDRLDAIEQRREAAAKVALAAPAAAPQGAVAAPQGLASPADAPTVYIICDISDLQSDFLTNLRNCLFDDGCEPVLLTEKGIRDPSLSRHLENLKSCDAFLIFYGAGSPEWFEDKLSDYRQYLRARTRPVLAKAIYFAPPDTQQKRDARTNEAPMFRAGASFSRDDIGTFLSRLSDARAGKK